MTEELRPDELIKSLRSTLRSALNFLDTLESVLKAPPVKEKVNWRDKPATPEQIAFLRKYRNLEARGLTRGEASDLIDEVIRSWRKR